MTSTNATSHRLERLHGGSPPGHAARRARRARVFFGAIVVAMVVAAGILSVAILHRSSVTADGEERQAFDDVASAVAAELRLDIQRKDDLVIGAAAFASADPDLDTAELDGWLTAMRARDRYVDLLGVIFLRVVPAEELPEYLDLLRRDAAHQGLELHAPPSDVPPHDLVVPPGARPQYCFMQSVGAIAGDPLHVPPTTDVCVAPETAEIVAEIEGLGTTRYEHATDPAGDTLFFVTAPVYVDDVVIGGIAAQVDMEGLLQRALDDHPGLSATLRYEGADTEVSVIDPDVTPTHATEVVLLPGWSLAVQGSVPEISGMDRETLATLALGVVAAVMSAVLVYSLGTGRARALELVDGATAELRHQALHDALTGLPNRALIADRTEALLARARRDGTLPAAMFVDLDGFKDVNDSLGHEVGDELLRSVSGRLTRALRSADTIGRLGGDEFVVLVDGASTPADPELVADRLLDAMREPFFVGGEDVAVRVTASVGIAVGDRPTAVDLLRDADVALYEAKAAGRDCWRTYDSGHESTVRRRNEIEFELRKLDPDESLRLVYQPIFDLDGLHVVDVEALLRWDHSTRGEISPGEFIPLLERSGRIGEIGEWVLEHACTQLAAWRAEGMDIGVAVNVSARQLDDDRFVDRLAAIVDRAGIPPSRLTVEVTETALMTDPVRAAAVLRSIKELDIRIAIDDFGTGYSSLAYLQRFPVDTLKIDRTFVSALDGGPEATALVGTLVELGRQLGLRTLAEGVETLEQVEHLRSHFVDEVQGFLLSRPISADEVRVEVLGRHGAPRPVR